MSNLAQLSDRPSPQHFRLPHNCLARKLGYFIRLSEPALAALDRIARKTFVVAKQTEIVAQGQPCHGLSVLMKGGAIRYKQLPDGRHQIASFVVPGDFVGVSGLLFAQSLSSVVTLEDSVIAPVELAEFHILCRQEPFLLAAIFWDSAIEHAMAAERLATLGRHAAQERVAFLLLEIWERLRIVGLAEDRSYTYPLNRQLMADALGLSEVHVSRTLKWLEHERIVSLRRKVVTIHDMAALKAMAKFEEGYSARYKPSRWTEHILTRGSGAETLAASPQAAALAQPEEAPRNCAQLGGLSQASS